MGSFTVYPPRGDYRTLASQVGGILGEKAVEFLMPAGMSQEERRAKEFANALATEYERVRNSPDPRTKMIEFVAGALQNGMVKVRDGKDAKSIGEMIDLFTPQRQTAEMNVTDAQGNPTKVRVPTDQSIGTSADLNRVLRTEGLSTTDFGQEPTYNAEGRMTGVVRKTELPKPGETRGDELKVIQSIMEGRRADEGLAIRKEELAAQKARDAEARTKGDIKTSDKEYEREARGLLARFGEEVTSQGMDRAVNVLKQQASAERMLLAIAGGRIKDNAVMWDNEGNRDRYIVANAVLLQQLWRTGDAGAAAAAAWKAGDAAVPKPEPLPPPEKPPTIGEQLRGLFGGGQAPAPKTPITEPPISKPAAKAGPRPLPTMPDGGLDRGKLDPNAVYEFKGETYRYDPKSKTLKKVK